MSPQEMSNLFQRFGQSSRSIQAEYGGTGLGLSICQEIVHLQGGRMLVESEKGRGSTFSFTGYYDVASEEDVNEYLQRMPNSSAAEHSNERRSSEDSANDALSPDDGTGTLPTISTSRPSPGGESVTEGTAQGHVRSGEPFRFKHVLVAEDNSINQNIMKTYLTKLGYAFTIVGNGQEVMDTFLNKTHPVPIDVILMDCEMPVMDGRQATMYIRQHEQFRRNFVTPLASPLEEGGGSTSNTGSAPLTPHYMPGSSTLTTPPPVGNNPGQTSFFPNTTPEGNRRRHRTPIIGLSGNARKELVDEAYASGMDDYVVKPFKMVELDNMLKKWERKLDEQLMQRATTLNSQSRGTSYRGSDETFSPLSEYPAEGPPFPEEQTSEIPVRPSLLPNAQLSADNPFQMSGSKSSGTDNASLRSNSSTAPSSSSIHSNSSLSVSSPASSVPTNVSSAFSGGRRLSKGAESR